MANLMDPVLSCHTSQERQSAAVPELPNDQRHQPPKQNRAEDHNEQMEVVSLKSDLNRSISLLYAFITHPFAHIFRLHFFFFTAQVS